MVTRRNNKKSPKHRFNSIQRLEERNNTDIFDIQQLSGGELPSEITYKSLHLLLTVNGYLKPKANVSSIPERCKTDRPKTAAKVDHRQVFISPPALLIVVYSRKTGALHMIKFSLIKEPMNVMCDKKRVNFANELIIFILFSCS